MSASEAIDVINELASYPRIEERESENGARNQPPDVDVYGP
jgi:hypothetical protein